MSQRIIEALSADAVRVLELALTPRSRVQSGSYLIETTE